MSICGLCGNENKTGLPNRDWHCDHVGTPNEKRCKKCGHKKSDLVHPENWREHQHKVMAENPDAKEMMNRLAHSFEEVV